jgi:radical SAM superfamily enzyme YgiQ (UPF0313 family)
MINITLIETGTRRRELNEPIGIESLAAQIRDAFSGFVSVNLLSLQLVSLDDCKRLIRQSDILGISAQIGSLEIVKQIIDLLPLQGENEVFPILVLGNILPTFAASYFLSQYHNAICVRGEGEAAIVDIIKCLLTRKPNSINQFKRDLLDLDVKNLSFMINNKIISTSSQLIDLTTIKPPSRDFLSEILRRNGIVRIEGSRGCSWGKCSFCSVSAKYGTVAWRQFPIERVLAELQILSDAGAKCPYFTDEDLIGSDAPRVKELASRIIEAKQKGVMSPNLEFVFATSVNTIIRIGHQYKIPELFVQLQKAGLREIFVGIESGSPTQLERYRKGYTVDQSLLVLNTLSQLTLAVDIGFIMFDPEMTFEELVDNLGFIEKANLKSNPSRFIKPMRIIPQTDQSQRYLQYGLIHQPFDVSELNYSFEFADSKVQAVYESFKAWEADTINQIYEIQATVRGETSGSSSSVDAKKVLGSLRELDYEFLKAIISTLESYNSLNNSCCKRKLYKMDNFLGRRKKLISKLFGDDYNEGTRNARP